MFNKFTGRKLEKLLSPFIITLSYIMRLIPFGFRAMLYDVSKFIPTKVGVFIRMVLINSLCECKANIYIACNVTIKNFKNLSLGENVSIHENCFIDAIGNVTIGDNVSIAHNSSIISFEHTWGDENVPIKYNKLKLMAVTICTDVWIGSGVRILAGSYIANRSIVAAGCIVNNIYPKGVIIGGVPSKIIKEI